MNGPVAGQGRANIGLQPTPRAARFGADWPGMGILKSTSGDITKDFWNMHIIAAFTEPFFIITQEACLARAVLKKHMLAGSPIVVTHQRTRRQT